MLKPFQICAAKIWKLNPFAFRLSPFDSKKYYYEIICDIIQIQTQFVRTFNNQIFALENKIVFIEWNFVIFFFIWEIHGSSFIELQWNLNINLKLNTKLHGQYCKTGF